MEATLFILFEISKRIFYVAPVVWEVFNDRRGDHNKKQDVFIRGLLCVAVATLDALLYEANVVAAFLMAVAFFILTFDYSFNKFAKIDGAKRPVFKYLSEGGVDSWKPWVAIGWIGRLAARILLFAASVWIYTLTMK